MVVHSAYTSLYKFTVDYVIHLYRESAVLAAPPKRIAFHNPTYEGAAKIKLEEIVDGRGNH